MTTYNAPKLKLVFRRYDRRVVIMEENMGVDLGGWRGYIYPALFR